MTHAYDPPRLPTEIGPSALEDLFDAYLVDNKLFVNEVGRDILRQTFFAGCLALMLKQDHARKIAETHGSDHARLFQLMHDKLEKEILEYVKPGLIPIIGPRF